MAFNTIVVYIVVGLVYLLDHIHFPRSVYGMAQATEIPSRWFKNSNAVGVSGMVEPRAVAGLTSYAFVSVSTDLGGHVVMTFSTGIPAGIMWSGRCIFLQRQPAVVAIFPERIGDKEIPDQKEEPDKYGKQG